MTRESFTTGILVIFETALSAEIATFSFSVLEYNFWVFDYFDFSLLEGDEWGRIMMVL